MKIYKIRIFYYTVIASIFLRSLNYSYALNKKDEISIKTIINEYVAAWNQSDANKFSEAFSSDAGFINIFGQKFKGRTEIRDRHDLVFKTFLKNSKFELVRLELKEMNLKDIVIAYVNWKVGNEDKSSSPQNQSKKLSGIFTHVFVKENGKWLIVTSQNTLVKESLK